MSAYAFSVEEIYSGRERTGTVELTDDEVARLVRFLKEEDPEGWLFTSSLEERHPELFDKLYQACIPLMDALDKEEPDGSYRAYFPDAILEMAGIDEN